ncbi:MAG: hypothetical protein ACOYPR_18650, partial [Saprospiraceae bacterium]
MHKGPLHRYPGTKPFEIDEKSIFFGREEETLKLNDLIRLERLVVLYSKSGLGKSSLLNAGVLPLLKEHALVIPIRFNARAENIATPLHTVLETIHLHNSSKDEFIENFAIEIAPIWASLKGLQKINRNTQNICLVFDQFEELFTHANQDIIAFKTALSEAFFEELPQKVRALWEQDKEKLTTDQQKEIFTPFNLKLVLSIREDKMSLLDGLKDVFPNILKTTYLLKALNRIQAEQAILLPAYKQDGRFKVSPFDYEDEAIEDILTALSNAQQQIEAPQLQIICRHAEKLVETGQVGQNENKVPRISRSDLGDLSQIYRDYYIKILADIDDNFERENVQKILEEELIYEPDERRIPCFEKIILDRGVSVETLHWLEKEHHILRPEVNVGGGTIYELSHDVLVKPILSIKQERIARAQQQQLQQEKEAAEVAVRQAAEKVMIERQLREIAEKARRHATAFAVASGLFAFIAASVFLWGLKQEQTNNRIIKHVDFYNGLALGIDPASGQYGYMDEDGRQKIAYKYKHASTFDRNQGYRHGYAEVEFDGRSYLIDASGKEYRLAKSLADLDSSVTILDLSRMGLAKIPDEVWKNTQLRILILYGNEIDELPREIGWMK